MEQRKVSGIGTILLLTGLFCLLLTNHSWGSNQQTSSAEEGTDVTITGELTVLSVDDFDRRSAKVLYQLKDPGSGRVFNLHFPGEPSGKLRTGSIVTVRGKAKGRDIYLMADIGGSQIREVVTSAPPVAGEQKTIVMVADFLDESVACSVPDVDYRVFTDPLNKSVDDLYQEMSFGQVWLTGDVVGPFTINYSTASTCDLTAWTTAADVAASAAGVNLAAYNRKIYVLPRNNPCGYTGVGTVGGNPSMSWIFRCDRSETFAHELGHNLGMNHASTPTDEYGDLSDIMGYSGVGLRQINGPHQDQMGWLDPQQIKVINESGIYNIASLELNSSAALFPQIIMLAKPDTGESYYLSYRQALGFDANLWSTYLNGVNIHRHKTDSATRTYLLGVLADGGSFTDSVNGVTITQVSHTDQYVTVQVEITRVPVCINNAPTVSISPIGKSAQGGSALTYSVSLTNIDSVDCAQTTFSLTGTVPAGWTGMVSPATLTLSPGATGSASLAITSPNTAAAGDYAVTVDVSDGVLPAHTASGTATYTVLPKPVCIASSPVISISPVTQSGQAGSTLSYSVSVMNKDSADCAAATFSLNRSLPAGWTGTVSPSTLSLTPGAGGSGTFSVTSPNTSVAGNYGLSVTISDSTIPVHTASVNTTYAVIGDTTPPTVPGGLTATLSRKKVTLSWATSTDNMGVTGYKVWRNNVVIVQTTDTFHIDYSVTTGQTYTYFITASDAAGNSSAASNQVTVNISAGGKK